MDLYNGSLGNEDEPEMALTLEEYEEAKKELEHTIARGDAAKRLNENPDFKLLIVEGYFGAEVQRLTGLMLSGTISKQVLDGCASSMDAIGKCRAYCTSASHEGSLAREELKELEAARDEALEAAAEGETLGE